MNVLLILVIFSGGFEVFQLVEGTRRCRRNEVYVKCVNRCNTCVNRGHCSQIAVCDPGCDCKRGYYRNRDGLCVPEKECDEPGNLPCRDDEEYRECSCVRSCCNRGDPEACSKQCLSGCFCREGLVRDQFGDCIKLEECQTAETPSNCTGDEQFYKNKPDCKNTCENYDNAAVLCLIGKPGCFCKEGLVKRKDGKCVKPEECFKGDCGEDEQYYENKPDCKNTCQNYNNPRVRCASGKPGCFCKEGLVKNRDGKCVKPEECPRGKCGKDEQYYKYKPDCKNTCENYNNPGIRCARGKPGCFCKEGLVKRKDGKCVRPEKCSEGDCGEDEQYYENKPDCKNTCQNYNNPGVRCASGKPGCFCKEGLVKSRDGKCVKPEECPGVNKCQKKGEVFMKCGPPCGDETCLPYRIGIRCLKKCKPGCFCKKGLVRDSKGNCVKRSECDHKKCGTNEEHNTCGTACEPTCDNQNPICTKQCKDGCFCKKGFIRDQKSGKCIPVEQCPTDNTNKCQKRGEVFMKCGPPCGDETCLPYRIGIRCQKKCKPGCFCKKGLVRDSKGNCVKRSECDNKKCGTNEEHDSCGTACEPTCDNQNPICTKQCKDGCFCKKGFIREKESGKCIPIEQCPTDIPEKCGKNEEYKTCGGCQGTCDIPDPFCTKDCKQGCYCKEGYIREEEGGKCIPVKECPNKKCGKNEMYLTCGGCQSTCDDRNPECTTEGCRKGCYCKAGYVRAKKGGRCIPVDKCPKGQCPYGEEYVECGSRCPATCDNYGERRICTADCVAGCFCKKGMVRNKEGKCVVPEMCGREVCYRDEQFESCGTACPDTCENYGKPRVCTLQCVQGCFCKTGLVRRDDFRCVTPEKCKKKKCNKDEVYKKCGTACPETCANQGKRRRCTKNCVSGCFCKDGLVRDLFTKKCIPPKQCGKDICDANEEFQKCGTACQPTCSNRKPVCIEKCEEGCFCKKGFIREKEGGRCIAEKKCPKDVPQKCDKYEEYTTCGGCQATCDNRNPFCTKECKVGCYCKKGYIREKDGGRCIPEKKCPKDRPCPKISCIARAGCYLDRNAKPCPKCVCSGEPGVPGDGCGKNEEYKSCGSCQPTCDNRNPICTLQCRQGCYCKSGFIRESSKGNCIPIAKCSKGSSCPKIECNRKEGCYLDRKTKPCPKCVCPIKPGDKCGKFEEHKTCGTACQPTCGNKNPVCTDECVDGCFCKDAYIRDKEGGRCIPRKSCPPAKCNADEEYTECGSLCPATCSNYGEPRFCATLCVPGCFCKKGTVRHSDGRCVIPERCNNEVCYDKEEYLTCGSSCPDTCDNYGKDRVCTFDCVPGCFCKQGLVRDDLFRCILPEKCEKGQICGVNEEIVDCAKPKWCNTCGIRGNCKLSNCTQGCDCKTGFYRDENGACIPESECPSSRPCPKIKCNRRKGCYLNSKAKPCPKCVCPSPQCSPPKCKKGCKIDYSTKPCPSCKCDGIPEGPQCSPPKCAKGCRIDYSTKPCPSCKCDEIPEGPQCSLPKCEEGCEIDYSTKPCPSCKCDVFPGGPQCDIPKCDDGCTIDYSTKPCPSCKCDTLPGGPQCDIPKCDDGCTIDYSTKPCPSCKCDTLPGGPQCGIPKCDDDCTIDYSTKPCPSCKCDTLPGGPQCDIPKCDDGCTIDYSTEPCPSCKCDTLPGGPQCDIPKCDDGCTIDYSTKPCPSCQCDTLPGGPECSIPKCDEGCTIDYSTKPCPSCKCEPEIICDEPICDEPGCKIDYSTKPCPTCKCEEKPPSEVCGKDEEFVECVPCGNTCETYEQRLYCKPACRPGCTCKEGLVKSKDGKCVLPEKCDKDSEPPTEVCGKDEEYVQCVPCGNTCEDYEIRPVCFPNCRPGCTCKGNLVKRKDGKCVPTTECERDSEPSCGKDEQYYECVPICNGTCETYDKGIVCKAACRPGCFCKEGLVLRKDEKCVKPDKCFIEECGPNEVYSTCVNPCNDCQTKGNCNFLVCNKGCDCKKGYYRNEKGKCIPEKQCPKEEPPKCGKDEEYYDCIPSCKGYCETYNKNIACKMPCKAGCFCKKGLVKRKDGKCVKPKQCSSEVCGRNEVYSTCVNPCNDCQTRGKCNFLVCNKGCDCRKNYYRNAQGKCIPARQCPKDKKPQKCSADQEYYDCKPTCRHTCRSYNSTKVYCSQICIPGCFCKKGLVITKEGKCVEPQDCPKQCRPDEKYYKCKPSCTNRCNPPDACSQVCVPGCFCRDGLVLRDDGKCVKKDQCKPVEPACEKDEQYYDCKPDCQNTCKAYGKNVPCPKICSPGCFCKEGLVKREDGKCVKPEQCKKEQCRPDEEYYECKPSCTNVCDPPDACIQACIPGCFCRQGLVQRKDGKCVKKDQCEKKEPTCKKDEQYYDCKPDCQNTCKAYGKNVPCPLICSPGCFCKEGLVKREDGKCVKPEQCKKEQCKPDEEYYKCKPFCANRCNPLKFCPRICVSGCFCRKGLVQRDDGKCVKKNECKKTSLCKKDEQYYDCIPDCRNTCETYGKPDIACPAICKKGCFCKKGLVKRKDGKCVRPKDCGKKEPPTEVCGKDEEYVECVPCGNTCENYEIRPVCRPICKPGCTCKGDLVKRKDGKCVPTTQCEEKECPKIKCPGDCYYDRFHKPCPRCLCHKKPGDNPKDDEKGDHDGGEEGNEGHGGSHQSDGDDDNYDNEGDTKGEGGNGHTGSHNSDGDDDNYDNEGDKKGEGGNGHTGSDNTHGDDDNYDNEGDTKGEGGNGHTGSHHSDGDDDNYDDEGDTKGEGSNGHTGSHQSDGDEDNYDNEGDTKGEVGNGHTGSHQSDGDDDKYDNEGDTKGEGANGHTGSHHSDVDDDNYDKEGDTKGEGGNGHTGSDHSDGDDDNYDDEGDTKGEGGNGHTVCKRNEVYSTCVIPCNNCEEKGDCKFTACHKGCDCKKGYYRNKKGRCIPKSKCPKPVCGRNEVYSKCVNPCNNCEIKGKCQFLVCNKGCDCKAGYYRNEQNKCIPEYKCPNKNSCPKLFCARGCHLDITAKPCPRCVCPKKPNDSCPQMLCAIGCYLDNTAKPCPRCVCPENPNDGGYETKDEYMEDYYSETIYEETVDEQPEYDSYTVDKRSIDYTETNEMNGSEHSSNTGDAEENCDTESGDEGSKSRGTKESDYTNSPSGLETNENTYIEEYQESFPELETGEYTYIEEYQESDSGSETDYNIYIDDFEEGHSGRETGENISVEVEGSEEDSHSDD